MKFIVDKTIHYVNADRVRILKRDEDFFKRGHLTEVIYLCNIVLQTTCDWNIEDTVSIISDTDSIQYRPKSIFGNKKGYYYKSKNTTFYLTTKEVTEMFDFIILAKKHIENKFAQ